MAVLWCVCGRFCELVSDCLWNVQKKLFLGVVWMKRKIWTIKGLFGQLKSLFSQFLCPIKELFCGHFTCHTLP